MFHHVTVLKQQAIEGLSVQPDGIYVDCTLGGAGHSQAIAEKLSASGLLIGLDQDDAALRAAEQRLSPWMDRVKLIRSNFRHLAEVLRSLPLPQDKGVPQVNGVLFDLGVSSPQLDEAERGFSYNQDSGLDMRMDRSSGLTAEEIVNGWPEGDIARILFEYGEEKFSRRIAASIVRRREREPIRTTGQLAELIKESIPAAARRSGPHPAKRSFQAIRIAVNDELAALEEGLDQAVRCLAPGGRVAVITFHSLEDRVCKQSLAKFVETCSCPPDFPVCVCQKKQILKIIARKPISPSDDEVENNPRARSAKLRIAEKI